MPYSDDEILSALQDCYDQKGKVTIRNFRDFKGPSSGTVINRFGTFNDALENANIPVTEEWNNYSDEELLNQVRTVAKQNGSIRPKYFGGDFADRGQIDRRFGSIGKAAGEANCHKYLTDYFSCDDCGGLFINMSTHIKSSKCKFTELSEYEKSIYIGLLLGDGYIVNREGSPSFGLSMSGQSGRLFTEWLEDAISLKCRRSMKELENSTHSDVYKLYIQSHPFFYELSKWYDSGRKKYPKGLELNPTILKMWYIGDGSLKNGTHPIITCWNESNRPDFLLSLFNDIGLNTTWQSGNNDIYIKKESRGKFFEYIGSPLPGYEYKWDY